MQKNFNGDIEMWELYEELIGLIPEETIVKEFTAGISWFAVTSGEGGVSNLMCFL
jgi:hypothetical protein